MLMLAVLTLFGVAGAVLIYVLFVRPLWRKWCDLPTGQAWWRRLQVLLQGLKIKLLARLIWVPTVLVEIYDNFSVICASCDLTPVKVLLPQQLQDAWPVLAAVLVPVLIDIARSYSSKPASV